MLSTRSERLTNSYQSPQREREQRRLPDRRSGRLCRRRDEREPAGSLSYFTWLPELDHVFFADDGHLAPALFVIRRAGVRHRQVVIRRHHAADLVQRLDPRLAREHLVLDRIAADSFVSAQTARPQASRPSRPPPALRPALPAGSPTPLI